jgi:hypothetical protein
MIETGAADAVPVRWAVATPALMRSATNLETDQMKLLTKANRTKLEANARKTEIEGEDDHRPVVKLFDPCGAATWLLTELYPGDPDIAFGLCDLGHGSPELGSVSITELEAIKGPLGIGIERDQYFEAEMTISQYAEAARASGSIAA